MEGALRLRKVAADFGDDLRQEDIKKLMFLRDIPQGIQERLTNAVEVFQHLEETAKLNFRDPQAIIDVMREMKKEKWALDTEKQFGEGTISVVKQGNRMSIMICISILYYNYRYSTTTEGCDNRGPQTRTRIEKTRIRNHS